MHTTLTKTYNEMELTQIEIDEIALSYNVTDYTYRFSSTEGSYLLDEEEEEGKINHCYKSEEVLNEEGDWVCIQDWIVITPTKHNDMSDLNATLIGMTQLDEIFGVKDFVITDYKPKDHIIEITPKCGAIFDHELKQLTDTFQCADVLWNAENGFIISIKDNFYF